MSEATPTQQLASLLLGQPVHNWIAMQRASGSSWRKIADDLRTETGGKVNVTYESVRLWNDEVAA
jgi:hypothetical protein